MDSNTLNILAETRTAVAAAVRSLRTEHRFTQKQLAQKLGLSQARLSELERGDGSFAAEQLIVLLTLFNVTVTQFAPRSEPDEQAALHNALARLGAAHLQESQDRLPSERLAQAGHVVREALVVAAPRLLTALAPVLVHQIDRLSLPLLDAELRDLRLDHRLGWLADNVLDALRAELARPLGRELLARCRRAETILTSYLQSTAHRHEARHAEPTDVLDTTIRSVRSLDDTRAQASVFSRRWNIVTDLLPADFLVALERARAGT